MDPDAVLPLLAYYGTDRLGLHGRMTGKARASAFKNRFRGYDGCLQSSLNYRQMDAWWRKQYDRSLKGYDVPTTAQYARPLNGAWRRFCARRGMRLRPVSNMISMMVCD